MQNVFWLILLWLVGWALFPFSRRIWTGLLPDAGLATGIARAMGKLATVGLAAAVFGPLMNITGSALASWWHNRLPKEDAPGEKNIGSDEKVINADVI